MSEAMGSLFKSNEPVTIDLDFISERAEFIISENLCWCGVVVR